MRRRNGSHDRAFAECQATHAMYQRNAPELGPTDPTLSSDFFELGNDHFVVRLVLEMGDVGTDDAVGVGSVVADGTAEQHDCTTIRLHTPLVHGSDRQFGIGQTEPVVAFGRWEHTGIVAVCVCWRCPQGPDIGYDLAFVERGPVPPHERTWRHPSELAAEERLELRAVVAPRTTRVTALAAGTFGLLVVAALVLVVTPTNLGAPIAVGASTTLADSFSAGNPVGDADLGSAALGIGGLNTLATGELSTTTTVAAVLAALATPVGDGSYAIVTMKSLAGQRGGTVLFRLRSGDTATGEIMWELDDAALLSIPTAQTPHAIATDKPHHSDMVTVMSDTPVDMAFAEVTKADVPEGTPIVDDEGALVGLCSKRDDGTTAVIEVTEVIEIDHAPVDPSVSAVTSAVGSTVSTTD